MEGVVYILQSLKNGRYYIGSTNAIERRFEEHCRGHVAATKYLLPLELKFFQVYESLELARRIEYRLKKLKSRKIIEKIVLEKEIKLSGN